MSDKRIDRRDDGLLQIIVRLFARIVEIIRSILQPAVPVGPRVDSFTPSEGYPGTALEISGTNFSAARAANHVQVGGKDAMVVEASPIRLKVIAGTGTQTGPIEVEVGGHTGTSIDKFMVLKYPAPDSEEDGPPIFYAGAGKGQAGGLPSTGTLRLLVVPCHTADRVPASPANARQDITNRFNDARTYYLQASYNTLTINVTVANWVQLSGNYSDYVRINHLDPAHPDIDWWVPNVIDTVTGRLHAEAASGYENQAQGNDLDNFDMMAVVIFGNGQGLRAWGDMKESHFLYDDPGHNLHFEVTVGHDVYLVDLAETADWGRIAHEIGHNIVDGGLIQPALVQREDVYSSDLVDPQAATAEEFDLMGSHDNHPLFSGFFMHQLKYYSNANTVELTWDRNPFQHDYEILAHGLTQNTNPNRYHLVRIKITEGLSYYIEVRQRLDPTTPQVFDPQIPLDGAGPNNGGVIVSSALTDVINMNQQVRVVTLLHKPHVLKTGDVASDPLHSIKITVLDDNVVARPQVCRVRVEWAQTISPDPNGQFDLSVTPWDDNCQTDDIWIDRQPWGVYDNHDASGNPVGNGDKPRPKEINHFWGQVHNTGSVDASNVRLAFYAVTPPGVGDNGNWVPLPDSPKILSVSKNSSAKDFVNWVPVVGEHTCLKIVAEPQFGEVSPSNNSAQENVFEFEAPASSVPDPLTIQVAVRNPLNERTIALMSVRGVPEGYVVQFPHAWVWLDPKQERKMELIVVPVYDVKLYTEKEIPRANVKVDGRIPHSYQRLSSSGVWPASIMLPMGGILARVTPKQRADIKLWEDQEYNPAEAASLRGAVTPMTANQPVRVDLTDPEGRVRVQEVLTNASGAFHAQFDLTHAPSEDPYGKKPGEEETPVPGNYRAQAFIVNAPKLAEAESNVVQLKK